MQDKKQELDQVVEQLAVIQDVLQKSDQVFRFSNFGKAIRCSFLIGGLWIALLSSTLYTLEKVYGSFMCIPLYLKIITLSFYILTALGLTVYKTFSTYTSFKKRIKGISLSTLIKRLATLRYSVILISYLSVITVICIYLGLQSQYLLVIPVFSILYGLLLISANVFIVVRKLYFLGGWLIATGLITLILADMFEPFFVPIITLAAGFILTSILLYVEKKA
jgi:hypothetical protein